MLDDACQCTGLHTQSNKELSKFHGRAPRRPPGRRRKRLISADQGDSHHPSWITTSFPADKCKKQRWPSSTYLGKRTGATCGLANPLPSIALLQRKRHAWRNQGSSVCMKTPIGLSWLRCWSNSHCCRIARGHTCAAPAFLLPLSLSTRRLTRWATSQGKVPYTLTSSAWRCSFFLLSVANMLMHRGSVNAGVRAARPVAPRVRPALRGHVLKVYCSLWAPRPLVCRG